ncbi:MAG: hypothetical protein FJ125_05945 [Deltaproteobacteria bacterium]|nr:hypothetical protein [Deltaproteobacteria bacterium]
MSATPHDRTAEISVLGALLLDPLRMPEVAALLQPGDFFHESHRVVFQAMAALHESGVIPDPLLLHDELRRRGELERAGGPEALALLAEAVPTAANVLH